MNTMFAAPFSLTIPPILAGFLNVILLVWVSLQAPPGRNRKTFLLWSFALALWNIGIAVSYALTTESEALLGYRVVTSVVRFLPLFFLQFVMSVTNTWQEPKNRRIMRAAYLSTAVFFVLTPFSIRYVRHFYWGYYPVADNREALFGIPFFAMVFYALHLLYVAFKNADGARRKQMNVLLIGALVCFGGGVTNFLPLYGIAIYPIGNLANSLYSLLVAYAIVEHDLFAMRVALRRGTVYALLSGGLTVVYLVFVAVLRRLFRHALPEGDMVLYTTAFPITVILAPFMKVRIDHFVSHLFNAEAVRSTPLFKKYDMSLMGILATEMAHELSKPLTHIMNEESRLGGSAIEPSSRKSLARIRQEVQRVGEILDGFALLSPERPLHKIPMLLEDLLEETLLTLGIEEDRTIVLVRRYEKVPPIFVNPGQMVQVFTNILQNAWQAMGAGGTLTLSLQAVTLQEKSLMAITVEDTGPGIPRAVRSKLFEPFFTTKKKQGGKGVGLTISKAMVERHHGNISIESPINSQGGTRVTITLPVNKGDRE